MVRLAYNESEDRHYVSLGKGGRCRLHWALEDWGVGRSCAKTVDKATCEGSISLSLVECKGNELLDPGNMQADAGCLQGESSRKGCYGKQG